MSDSNGSKDLRPFIHLVGGLISLTIFAMTVWTLSATYTNNHYDTKHNATQHYDAAIESIKRSCKGLEFGAFAACVSEKIKATSEYEQGEDDLAAQQDMADWAFWMMLFAGITIPLTGVGIILVYLNLAAVRKTNEIQMDVGKATVRAYVGVSKISATLVELEVKSGTINVMEIELLLSNGGQTPAMLPSSNIVLTYIKEGKKQVLSVSFEQLKERDIRPGEHDYALVRTMIPLSDDHLQKFREKKMRYLLEGWFEYAAALDPERKITPLNFVIGPLKGPEIFTIRSRTPKRGPT